MRTVINFLNEEEKAVIHENTLELLEKVGVVVGSEKVCQLLAKKGAQVGGDHVKFPRSMVQEALELANKEIPLAARADKNSITIPAKDQTYATTVGYVPYVTEEGADHHRPATSEDLRKFAILSDALDEFGFFWPIVLPQDVPGDFQEYKAVELSFKHTTKHVQASVSDGEVAKWQIELACLLAGGQENLRKNPVLSLLAAPTTPLAIEHGISEAIVVAAQHGIPIVPMSLPQMGSTSPATVAANTLLANTEVLACYLVAKCADEKAPVIYAADTGAPDMRTMLMNYNNPEYFLLAAANADMARFYQLPSMVASGMTEYKDFSSPAGFERNVFKAAMALMTRTDLSCWFGSVNNNLSASFVELILDVEAYRYARPYLRSFSADKYKLAVDVITEVGPRGNFLAHVHTFNNFKEEIFTERIEDSFVFKDKSGKDYRQLAQEKCEQIIGSHQVAPLDEALQAEMDKISSRALQALAGS
jgi:trimethylamine---corrinoid protein Co-methyltransferase